MTRYGTRILLEFMRGTRTNVDVNLINRGSLVTFVRVTRECMSQIVACGGETAICQSRRRDLRLSVVLLLFPSAFKSPKTFEFKNHCNNCSLALFSSYLRNFVEVNLRIVSQRGLLRRKNLSLPLSLSDRSSRESPTPRHRHNDARLSSRLQISNLEGRFCSRILLTTVSLQRLLHTSPTCLVAIRCRPSP